MSGWSSRRQVLREVREIIEARRTDGLTRGNERGWCKEEMMSDDAVRRKTFAADKERVE